MQSEELGKQIEFTPIKNIIVLDRARKEFTSEGLQTLSEALLTNIGMLHPVIILKDNTLLTGERRLKVISQLHEIGTTVNFTGSPIPLGTIPTIKINSEHEMLDYLISEQVENTARESFTWQEKASLTTRIATLQQLKINRSSSDAEISEPLPNPAALSHMLKCLATFGNESKGENRNVNLSRAAIKETAIEIHGRIDSGQLKQVENNLKLDAILQGEDKELAKKVNAAPTQKEALKLIQVEETKIKQAKIAHQQGKELRGDRHTLINGECLVELKKIPSASINVCLTDPIYGINAHKFGVAKRDTGFHDYEDTPEEFERILPLAIKEVSRILKDAAHLYLFCDLSKFYQLKGWLEEHGSKSNPWKVQSFPLHWIKINGARCPHPGFTFRKNVEYILFAYRGGKQSHHQLDSYFEVSTKRTEVHGAAKEPSGLKILLNNSCYPGDSVLDFMAGSGSTIVAANELKLKCTAIEIDKTAYGRMVERTKELKS